MYILNGQKLDPFQRGQAMVFVKNGNLEIISFLGKQV